MLWFASLGKQESEDNCSNKKEVLSRKVKDTVIRIK
uniref:Uncharacterized protein n=1 Tax=Arundo donax TaxID=35708 RepID=A0A0A9BBZ0_ARUDO